MGRSHTLRVYRLQLVAHFGLAFATASCLKPLNLAADEYLAGSLCKRHAVSHPPHRPHSVGGHEVLARSRGDRGGLDFLFSSKRSGVAALPPVLSPPPMNSAGDDGTCLPPGFPIRTSPGRSLFAAHRGLSQLTT